MRIGIIGSGHIGSTLARLFVDAGHDVAISHAHDPAELGGLVGELGKKARAATPAEAATFGDVVVVAVPFGRYRELPAKELAGKIVVDTNNYYPDRDGHFAELDTDRTTSSELLSAALPGARVVKTFNTIRWASLRDQARKAAGMGPPMAIPVAGDDGDAKRTVIRLIESLPFHAVDSGSLAEGGRRQQPGSAVYLAELPAGELRQRLGAV